MKSKSEIFQSAYRNAYKMKDKNYISAKLYSANGDVKKRWYIYYSVLNPETGKMERQPQITMSLNRKYKTFKERIESSI